MALSQTPPNSPKPLAEVDIELFTFVERYATNLVRWDLLLFFGANPEVRLNATELARQVRRNVKATTKELDDLSYLRVLTRRYASNKATYALTHRERARQAVMRLAAYASGQKGIL